MCQILCLPCFNIESPQMLDQPPLQSQSEGRQYHLKDPHLWIYNHKGQEWIMGWIGLSEAEFNTNIHNFKCALCQNCAKLGLKWNIFSLTLALIPHISQHVEHQFGVSFFPLLICKSVMIWEFLYIRLKSCIQEQTNWIKDTHRIQTGYKQPVPNGIKTVQGKQNTTMEFRRPSTCTKKGTPK